MSFQPLWTCSAAVPLVLLDNCFGISRHDLGRSHPGLHFMSKFLKLGLGKVLHLSMEEFFRIAPFSEVERTPLIGILKDEPFAPSDGSVNRLSFHHAVFFSYLLSDTSPTRAERGG